MIIIFDLDDTLYEEKSFVFSGLKAVSHHIEKNFGYNRLSTYQELRIILDEFGRGAVFDKWLLQKALFNKGRVRKLLSVYRMHKPNIALPRESISTLIRLKSFPKYVVTDGNKIVQKNKVAALGIDEFLQGVYITHRFGLASAKPSLDCFNKIRQKENAKWNDLVYVGDNPNKDFVNLNSVGARTIQVMTGPYCKDKVNESYQALESINNISELPTMLGI
jgi:putative hydrolase of the HAD superfamily